MGKSKYSGKTIDEALEKASQIADQINGWTKIPSAPGSPVDCNILTNVGNYTIDNYINGPDTKVIPINISVFSLNGADKYQYVDIMGDRYQRAYKRDESTWGAWKYIQTNTSTSVQPSEPSNPDENTIWIDTADPEHPVFKIYIDGKWVEIRSPNMMDKNIYDPTGQAKDIFTYIDEAIAAADMGSISTDFESHIKDSSIHVTTEEKQNWNAKPTSDVVNEKIEEIRTEMESDVMSQASSLAQNISQLSTDVSQYEGDLNAHTENATIHPTSEKTAEWDAKAAADHTHKSDNSVEIDASKIVSGIISMDRIDPSAKERLYQCENESELASLTTEQVQNGDMIYVKAPKTNIYYVMDDSKLGTEEYMQGLKLFSTGITALTWDNISSKPTTISGFGITDAYTKDEVDERVNAIKTIFDEHQDALEGIGNFAGQDYNALYSAIQAASLSLDSVKSNHEVIKSAMTTLTQLALELDQLLV